MEIVQLCKSTYDSQVQQSIYLCHKKHVLNMAGEHTLEETKLKVTP